GTQRPQGFRIFAYAETERSVATKLDAPTITLPVVSPGGEGIAVGLALTAGVGFVTAPGAADGAVTLAGCGVSTPVSVRSRVSQSTAPATTAAAITSAIGAPIRDRVGCSNTRSSCGRSPRARAITSRVRTSVSAGTPDRIVIRSIWSSSAQRITSSRGTPT